MSGYTFRVALRHAVQAPFAPYRVIEEAQSLGITELGRLKAVSVGLVLFYLGWAIFALLFRGTFEFELNYIFWRETIGGTIVFIIIWFLFYYVLSFVSAIFLLPVTRTLRHAAIRTGIAYVVLQTLFFNILAHVAAVLLFSAPKLLDFALHGYSRAELADLVRGLTHGYLLILPKFAYCVVFVAASAALPTHVAFIGMLFSLTSVYLVAAPVQSDLAWMLDVVSAR